MLYSYRYGLTGMQNQHDDPKQNQHRMMQLNQPVQSPFWNDTRKPNNRYEANKQPNYMYMNSNEQTSYNQLDFQTISEIFKPWMGSYTIHAS